MSSASISPDRSLSRVAPYPAAQAGYCRHIVYLPSAGNENDLLVEMSVGRTFARDDSPLAFRGRIEKRVLPDWGYEYYFVSNIEETPVPMMAFLEPDQTEAFVAVDFGRGLLQRYNSKLPIVIYTPDGFSVRYRLWWAASHYQLAVRD